MAAVRPAGVVVCNSGETSTTFANKTTPWIINDALYIQNWSSGSFSHSETETRETSITAGVTVESGGKVTASDIISSLEANYNITVSAAGTTTGTTSYTTTINASPYTYVVGYYAAHKVTATYTKDICNAARNGWNFVSSGTVASWTTKGPGVVNCPGSKGYVAPASGSAPAAALKYCQ